MAELNVAKLKSDLEAMSTPHIKTGENNLWDVAVSINRTNNVPLDKSSIIIKQADTDINSAADAVTAYPGQIISELDDSIHDSKVYVLQPDSHHHETHPKELLEDETTSIAESGEITTRYEEFAFQSGVDYAINKETYNRKVSDNARRKSDEAISSFIGGNMHRDLETDVITGFQVPDELSDKTATPDSIKTLLEYLIATVATEKNRRVEATQIITNYIGSTDFQVDANSKIKSESLNIPDTLSDNTATPADKKSILDFIQATVEAEVSKRYEQDLVLLNCINELDLSEVIDTSEVSTDGILEINLSKKLRVYTDPLTKYNNEGE